MTMNDKGLSKTHRAYLKQMIDSETGEFDVPKTVKLLREMKGMTRNEFCKYLGIPYRTLQDWELGNRSMPSYVLRLMVYSVMYDVLPKEQDKKTT